MRTPLVAGNWKMNKTVSEATALVSQMLLGLQSVPSVERVICPPFTALMAISRLLEGTGIGLGAQDLYWEASGAFTGEISPAMVKEFCQYVIIGHSERRTYFGETDETVNKKTKAALAIGLIPIVCVGETLAENESGQTAAVVTRQVKAGLEGIPVDQAGKIVIAYEPVWAIGTGRASSGENANAVVANYIRPTLQSLFGREAAEAVRVLYGGSVKGDIAAEFFTQPEIDGALVGGASLKADDFVAITKAAAV
jgi:triosephosphate isomerase